MLALEAIFSLSSTLRAPSLEGIASRRYAGTAFSTPRLDARGQPLVSLGAASNRHAMARDDDDFRLRPGKIRDWGRARIGGRRVGGVRARPPSFAGQIQQAMRRAGGNPSRLNGTGKGSSRFNARGRGAAARRGGSRWNGDDPPRRRAYSHEAAAAVGRHPAFRRTAVAASTAIRSARTCESIAPAGVRQSETVIRGS